MEEEREPKPLWFLAMQEFVNSDCEMIEIHICKHELLYVLMNIQLALRHPDNTGHVAHVGKEVYKNWLETIEPSPGLRELMDAGFMPEFDREG